MDWAWIRITKNWVSPLPQHVEAIRNFPVPENITDMRSYWALVNQVSNFYATQPHLAPFRELMKKNTKWYWDDVLQNYSLSQEKLLQRRFKKESQGTIHSGGKH